MKKKTFLVMAVLLLTLSAAIAAQYKVTIKDAPIRKDKRFFAPMVTHLPYGATIQDQGRQGDWLKVTYKGQQGWLHIGAVQEQKFQLPQSGKAREASQEEVALAGKGFTPEVERAYRAKNPGLKYGEVDRVQSYRIDDNALQAFIQAGSLSEPGGGR